MKKKVFVVVLLVNMLFVSCTILQEESDADNMNIEGKSQAVDTEIYSVNINNNVYIGTIDEIIAYMNLPKEESVTFTANNVNYTVPYSEIKDVLYEIIAEKERINVEGTSEQTDGVLSELNNYVVSKANNLEEIGGIREIIGYMPQTFDIAEIVVFEAGGGGYYYVSGDATEAIIVGETIEECAEYLEENKMIILTK